MNYFAIGILEHESEGVCLESRSADLLGRSYEHVHACSACHVIGVFKLYRSYAVHAVCHGLGVLESALAVIFNYDGYCINSRVVRNSRVSACNFSYGILVSSDLCELESLEADVAACVVGNGFGVSAVLAFDHEGEHSRGKLHTRKGLGCVHVYVNACAVKDLIYVFERNIADSLRAVIYGYSIGKAAQAVVLNNDHYVVNRFVVGNTGICALDLAYSVNVCSCLIKAQRREVEFSVCIVGYGLQYCAVMVFQYEIKRACAESHTLKGLGAFDINAYKRVVGGGIYVMEGDIINRHASLFDGYRIFKTAYAVIFYNDRYRVNGIVIGDAGVNSRNLHYRVGVGSHSIKGERIEGERAVCRVEYVLYHSVFILERKLECARSKSHSRNGLVSAKTYLGLRAVKDSIGVCKHDAHNNLRAKGDLNVIIKSAESVLGNRDNYLVFLVVIGNAGVSSLDLAYVVGIYACAVEVQSIKGEFAVLIVLYVLNLVTVLVLENELKVIFGKGHIFNLLIAAYNDLNVFADKG